MAYGKNIVLVAALSSSVALWNTEPQKLDSLDLAETTDQVVECTKWQLNSFLDECNWVYEAKQDTKTDLSELMENFNKIDIDSQSLFPQVAGFNLTWVESIDQTLYDDYFDQLGEGMEGLANALVAGRKEYIENRKNDPFFTKTERHKKRFSTDFKKQTFLEKSWKTFTKSFFKWNFNTSFLKVKEIAPKFVDYLVDNYDELSAKKWIWEPVITIAWEKKLESLKAELAKNKANLAKNKRILNKINRLTWKLNNLSGKVK